MTIDSIMSGFRSMTIQGSRRTELLRKIAETDTTRAAWSDAETDLGRVLSAQQRKLKKTSSQTV